MGDNYPRSWPISTHPPIPLRFDISTRRLAFERSAETDAQWTAQYPNDGIVYLGEHRQPFTISMYHEIRCIDILRIEIMQMRGSNDTILPGALALHCLGYLRQMVMCRADLNGETVYQLPVGARPGTYRCNDWTKVYDAAEENQRVYR